MPFILLFENIFGTIFINSIARFIWLIWIYIRNMYRFQGKGSTLSSSQQKILENVTCHSDSARIAGF